MSLIALLCKWDKRWHWLKRCDLMLKRNIKKQPVYPPKLAEVGHLIEPKEETYKTGQLFLHQIFGYRGVILFPWAARVYDRDLSNPSKKHAVATAAQSPIRGNTLTQRATAEKDDGTAGEQRRSTATAANATSNMAATTTATTTTSKNEEEAAVKGAVSPKTNIEPKEVKGHVQMFYQVLIDARDCPHIRAQTEAVTFLGSQESNRSLYAIPGLDHVSHDDVMPYTTTDKHPLQHELFDKFLSHTPDNEPTFVEEDTLRAWRDKNHPWLDMTDVHKETTENIRVTVIPFYMGVRETPVTSVYWWRYCIRLENLGELSVQLRERHWRIFSLSGTLETVRGRGVVGQEPILSPRLPAFQYSSHVSLQSPSGHMWGTFRLEREDGYAFDCKIPPFSLESKPDEPITRTAAKTTKSAKAKMTKPKRPKPQVPESAAPPTTTTDANQNCHNSNSNSNNNKSNNDEVGENKINNTDNIQNNHNNTEDDTD